MASPKLAPSPAGVTESANPAAAALAAPSAASMAPSAIATGAPLFRAFARNIAVGMAALTYQAAVLTALLMMFATNGVASRASMSAMIPLSPVESRTDVTGEASPLTALGRLLIRSATLTWLTAAVAAAEPTAADWAASPPGLVVCDGGLNGCSIPAAPEAAA
ncbi:Uncharacterised protein [Mycobacterium tuberculosis]|nr:Uncharacterised protein [Mycobacterium tuberculosis]